MGNPPYLCCLLLNPPTPPLEKRGGAAYFHSPYSGELLTSFLLTKEGQRVVLNA